MSSEHVKEGLLENPSNQQLTEAIAVIDRTRECSVCVCILDIAVICNNGHGVCTACGKGLQACPTCRTAQSTVKPTMLNSVISLIPQPCRYSFNGCDITIIPSSEENHETLCGYREIRCYCYKCKWRGLQKDLLKHLKCDHANILLRANNPVVKWPVIEEYELFNMPVYAFGYIMCLSVWLKIYSLTMSISYYQEQVNPSHVAEISFKRGDIKFTDTIRVKNFSQSSIYTGLSKNTIDIPTKILDFFHSDG